MLLRNSVLLQATLMKLMISSDSHIMKKVRVLAICLLCIYTDNNNMRRGKVKK